MWNVQDYTFSLCIMQFSPYGQKFEWLIKGLLGQDYCTSYHLNKATFVGLKLFMFYFTDKYNFAEGDVAHSQ